ncbi:MAG: hypothetical protein IT565_04575 [Rhodospirillales bacterium]|nr:hypothetical protein [Rhodospirillales bacterium]
MAEERSLKEIQDYEERAKRRVQERLLDEQRRKAEKQKTTVPLMAAFNAIVIILLFLLIGYNWDKVDQFASWASQFTGFRITL